MFARHPTHCIGFSHEAKRFIFRGFLRHHPSRTLLTSGCRPLGALSFAFETRSERGKYFHISSNSKEPKKAGKRTGFGAPAAAMTASAYSERTTGSSAQTL